MRPFEIAAQSTRIDAAPAGFAADFMRQRAIVAPDMFTPSLLDLLLTRCRGARFAPDEVAGLGTREVEAPQLVGRMLNILLNRRVLLDWLEAVTGRGPLTTAEGRLVQTWPNGSDQLRWHDDTDVAGRKIAIVINLSDTGFTGGDFELRDAVDRTVLFAFHHAAPGTGLLFDVARGLEHRVTPLMAGGPRRVYTGWIG